MPRPLIGIDIGSTAVRAARVQIVRGKPRVTHAAEIPLPDDTLINGELRDPAVLRSALKLLWRVGGFREKDVIIGVANQQTLVRQVDLAYDPPEDFKESLPYKVAQGLPVDAGELSLDFYGLGDYYDAEGNQRRRALLVGAMNTVVDGFCQAAVEAGLRPRGVDFSGFALVRAAAYTAGNPTAVPGPPLPGEEYTVEVLVHVGGSVTVIVMHNHGRPIFIRLVQGGGASVTRAISDHLNLGWDVCEALKKALSTDPALLDKRTRRLASEVPRDKIPVVQQIMNMMASSLVQSVRESVDYFLAASPQVSEVSRVLLSGGGSMLAGYGQRVAAELRTDVGMLTPMAAFAKPRSRDEFARLDPRFSIAFGLPLGVQ